MSGPAAGATVEGLENVDHVLVEWTRAEAVGDPVALDALLDADFRGDGPRGFVLTKQEWLDRYRSGDLANRAFCWQDVHVRVYERTAVVMGTQVQEATYQGSDCSGAFRGTLVAVRRGDRWRIVNIQLAPVADP